MFELTPYDHRRNAELYDPWGDLEKFEKSFFGNDGLGEFRTDIKDDGDKFVLEADLPGFEKKDIKLDVNGDNLTISATRSTATEEKDKKGNYVRRERSYGSYRRSFDISAVKADGIKAEYKDGVLKLDLPKKGGEADVAHRIEIE